MSDISDGFNALAKHNINALAMGKVEKTPDEPFEVAERETTGLRLSVAALSKNASSFVANLTALTQSVESMATGFVAAGLEEAVDALTASETITGEIQAKAVEGLNANVVAHLRNKTEAPAGLNLLKRRRELKIEFDYYHQKVGFQPVCFCSGRNRIGWCGRSLPLLLASCYAMWFFSSNLRHKDATFGRQERPQSRG